MSFKIQNILLHVLLAIFMCMLPLLFVPMHHFHSLAELFADRFVWLHVTLYFLMFLFFCWHYYFLLPRFFFQKKHFIYFLGVFVFIILFFAFYKFVDIRPEPHEHRPHFAKPFEMRPPKMGPPFFQYTQFLFVYLVGIFVTLYLRTRQNMNRILNEKSKSEIQYLKSQINPHFLFNVFNTLYGLAIKENANATASAMLKLSEMMRYVTSEAPQETVKIHDEVNYIQHFIELQKLRLTPNVKLEVNIDVDVSQARIEPMLLLPFIENAFKHGVNPDHASSILISLRVQEMKMSFYVKNQKVVAHPMEISGMGIGMENTKARLNLLYPNCHYIQIVDNEFEHIVDLKLTLKS